MGKAPRPSALSRDASKIRRANSAAFLPRRGKQRRIRTPAAPPCPQGKAASPNASLCSRQAPAHGPAGVYSDYRPIRNETQRARPLLVGRARVSMGPKALEAGTADRGSGGPEAWGPEAWGPEAWGPEAWGPEAWGPEAWGPEAWGPEAWGPEAWGPEAALLAPAGQGARRPRHESPPGFFYPLCPFPLCGPLPPPAPQNSPRTEDARRRQQYTTRTDRKNSPRARTHGLSKNAGIASPLTSEQPSPAGGTGCRGRGSRDNRRSAL